MRNGKLSPRVLILELLAGESKGLYGQEMLRQDERLRRGSIYKFLGLLKSDGMVSLTVVATPTGESGPPRRKYKITTKGRRWLKKATA